MRYRTKNYLLPFYAGFNAAYFLKDYKAAAHFFQMASERSGNVLLGKLAARYFYESGQTQMGLTYLDSMIKGATDAKTRLIYTKRRDALLSTQTIEEAVSKYRKNFGRDPTNLSDLVERGVLESIPIDPYGGTFYLDEKGKVRTTSKFALTNPETEILKNKKLPMATD